ncbi:ZIP family metal transporter [Flavilitoribacter nigricans]|uniref:Zinc/iron permease n=1 Tax=Flavilitoribacter nigricans (strain ATCC 23147 / DSM 23189 / NBRC 102662 / NCIMB 1420 / SS-2) TaxID=1122177 RepID=A0A2D0NJF3_FLAN2|nr:ZIP family metal transporter [Flavilitoribacter nigricans]PHN08496.1 zinc/iron permease [Flavilitoribacter nigricans DSM 23189 = NBRC 102662]
MEIWEYILLFISVALGGALAFVLRQFKSSWIQLLLSFSGAYILGVTALHLLPSVYHEQPASIGIWVLLGFFLQLSLEQLSKGVEHGHIHAHQHAGSGFAISIMVGLCLHAFLEGLPLSHYHELTHSHHGNESWFGAGNHLLFGIILHKIPAAFALVTLLLRSGFKSSVAFGLLLLFASMSPLAAQLADISEWGSRWLVYIVAVVVGSFLHIATTILFESDDKHQHRISWKKLLAIGLGLGMGLVTL